MEDMTGESWRKSSHSGNGGSDCVEVADTSPVILVRDSKNPDGAVLSVPADAWRAFIAAQRKDLSRRTHGHG
jgi:Domain of unknown function (DUF397)